MGNLENATMSALSYPLVLVTGMAGAGRGTALKCLEDLGYEAVDNLPLVLLPQLLGGICVNGEYDAGKIASNKPLAIGIDSRTRGFSSDTLLDFLKKLATPSRQRAIIIYLDSDDEVLRRRFTETRRRHPLAPDRPVMDGIAREREITKDLRAHAEIIIDTSTLIMGELKSLLSRRLNLDKTTGPAFTVISFAYRNGLPREADLVFDVRFLKNPYYMPALRSLTGRDPEVATMLANDNSFSEFFASLTNLLWPLLPNFKHEGKSYLTIAIGCSGGQHRSVYVAERLAAWLKEKDHAVFLQHRDLAEK